jgi:hypothetical protein
MLMTAINFVTLPTTITCVTSRPVVDEQCCRSGLGGERGNVVIVDLKYYFNVKV